ncbi:helicase associated domain-containing protein [Streptomyces violascens]|uniref:helicase associated domain-containing protein n=1 Tax=Streptomyces violascens TaxID=67381 RepID=UPI00364EC094
MAIDRRGAEAFRRGLAAFAQYTEREQKTVIPRQHTERIVVEGQEHDVRLGVWLTNQKSRHDRLSGEQLAQLAELGIDWAQGRQSDHGPGRGADSLAGDGAPGPDLSGAQLAGRHQEFICRAAC